MSLRTHRLLRVAVLCGVFLSIAARPAASETDPSVGQEKGATYRSTPAEVFPGLGTQNKTLRLFHPLDGAISLRGARFDTWTKDGVLRVAVRAGKPALRSVEAATTLLLRVGEGNDGASFRVHLRPVPEPMSGPSDEEPDAERPARWEWAVVSGRAFDVEGAQFVVVDADGDGRFDGFGRDAFVPAGTTMMQPLTQDLVLGGNRVQIHELSETGSELTATVTPLAGSVHQVDLVVRLNRLRASEGLSAVRVSLGLSEACTSHAKYLEANGWSTYSNPHFEDAELSGYTPEGDAVARRGLIMGAVTAAGALDAFWRTYYHRLDLIDPRLREIGVSDGPDWITVLDARGAVPDRTVPASGWRDPILSPADGSSSFHPSFCYRGESPAPVPRAHRRGNALIVSFIDGLDVITNFRGKLVELTEDGPVDVPTLVAERAGFPDARGILPERRLRSGGTYRVTYTYDNDDQLEPVVLSATFTTR